jgi:hypothetical protein
MNAALAVHAATRSSASSGATVNLLIRTTGATCVSICARSVTRSSISSSRSIASLLEKAVIQWSAPSSRSFGRPFLESCPDSAQDVERAPEPGRRDAGRRAIRPRPLSARHLVVERGAARGEFDRPCAPALRVLHATDDALGFELVDQSLHRLACKPHRARDLGDRSRLASESQGTEHLPPRGRESRAVGERVPGGDERPVQSENLEDDSVHDVKPDDPLATRALGPKK